MYDLSGKVALVTGAGRKKGIGRSIALRLAQEGADVAVNDILKTPDDLDPWDKEAGWRGLDSLVAEIRSLGRRSLAITADITRSQEASNMVGKVVEEFGKIDILVNNAGICEFKPFLEITEEDWNKTIDINLKGYFLCGQAAAKEMAKQNSGVIVNIASIAMGQVGVGFPAISHYCASKGGIVAMTEAMALELASYNIRVNAIAPGAIDTPMAASVKDDPKILEATLTRVPLKRMGKPEEISNAVLFLASDASSYMTGSVMVVDGGWLAG